MISDSQRPSSHHEPRSYGDVAALLQEPLVLVPAVDLPALPDLSAVGIRVAALLRRENGLRLVAGILEAPLLSVPPLCLGVLSASGAGLALAEEVYRLPGAGSLPPLQAIGPRDGWNSVGVIAAEAIARLRIQARLFTATLDSLAQLRAVRDDQQRRLAALEDYLAWRNTQPFELAFEEDPDPGGAELSIDTPGYAGLVTQLLPVPSRGVVAVGLHIPPSALEPAALALALESCEDGTTVAEWTIAAEDRPSGWLVLGLERAITGLNRSLRLQVRGLAGGGRPRLSLGPTQPLPMFRAVRADGEEIAARSIAFRVWTGLPGVVPPLGGVDLLPDGAAQPEGFACLPVDLRGSKLLTAPAEPVRGPHVLHLPQEDAVAVHAPREGTAIAVIPGALTPGTVRVAAEAWPNSPNSPPVLVALASIADARSLAERADTDAPACPGWSGWMRALPSAPVTLRLHMVPVEGDPADLALLTRRESPGPSGPAWARFERIFATVLLSPTLSEEAGTGPEEPLPVVQPGPLAPYALEGRGLHEPETEGGRSWRWFGPDVTLTIRQMGQAPTALSLTVAAVAPGVELGRVSATFQGVRVPVAVAGEEGGGQALVIQVPGGSLPRDGVATLRLQFATAHSPPGDARMLTIACTGLRIQTGSTEGEGCGA